MVEKVIKIKKNEHAFAAGIIVILALILFLVAFFTDGTGGQSDSTMHYLFARFAFSYPQNFLDHWGKPLFTLFASPFAYFGFDGIQVFNIICACLALYFTYRSAVCLGLKNPLLAIPLLFFCPLFIKLMFSGLTEHFFALILIISFFLWIQKKEVASVIVVSFLPFARSEGLVILGVWLVFLIFQKKFRLIPLLLSGHLIYGIVGWIWYYHDPLWIFTKIPYAHLSSIYGSGNLFHFFNKMTEVAGIPVYFFLIIGIFYIILTFFNKKLKSGTAFYPEVFWLIYGVFAAFFIAHTLFWYFGIFNSMGLSRVLIDVLPLVAVMALFGFNYIESLIRKIHRQATTIYKVIVILLLAWYPFSSNPYKIDWKKDFYPEPDQKLINDMTSVLKPKFKDRVFFYEQSYISIAFDFDHFDPKKRLSIEMAKFPEVLKEGAIIIWEPYFSVQLGITTDLLNENNGFFKIQEFKLEGKENNRKYIVFEYHKPPKGS